MDSLERSDRDLENPSCLIGQTVTAAAVKFGADAVGNVITEVYYCY